MLIQGKYREGNSLVTHCGREISRINKFRLDARTLARPSALPDTIPDELNERLPRVDYFGAGLASVLYYLVETANPMLDSIVERVAAVIDGFEGFDSTLSPQIESASRLDSTTPAGAVAAANQSDGTLSLIGLLVLLSHPDRPPILCLEEPENGLTPRATRAVYEAVVAASKANEPETRSQILISSHSPFVIFRALERR